MSSTSAVNKLREKLGAPAQVIQHPSAAHSAPVGSTPTIQVPEEVRAEVEAQVETATKEASDAQYRRVIDKLMAACSEDQYGAFVLRLPVGQRIEAVNIESSAGRDLIFQVLHEASGKPPPKAAIEAVQTMLRNDARHSARRVAVHQRIASDVGARYVDLGDPAGHVGRVTRDGWEVVQQCEVIFARGRAYGALPLPERCAGPHAAFKQLVEWLHSLGVGRNRLGPVLAVLVSWLRLGSTYPVLALYGPPGSGKSTAARLILSLIDPTESLALPNTRVREENIAAAAQQRHVLSFDNLSKLSAADQDMLCICATGGEIVARKLYTDADAVTLPVHRPVLLTSVSPVTTRADLLSRTIPVEFAKRESERSEEEIQAEFLEARPALLGALFDMMVAAEG